ncbi:MAG: hypothetical protein IPJ30_11990 [Acidobacteria bacterium]|nr:hypothetical protein [Acidobacteriota bacterium]
MFGRFDNAGNLTLRTVARYPELAGRINQRLEPFRPAEGETEYEGTVTVNDLPSETAAALNASDLIPYGTVFVLHTYWLPSFFPGIDGADLKKIVEAYNDDSTGIDLSGDSGYEVDGQRIIVVDESNEERRIIENGDLFAVFKKRLHKEPTHDRPIPRNWLTVRTYSVTIGTSRYSVRLGKTGVIEIREEFDISATSQEGDERSLAALLESLLRYRKPGETHQRKNVEVLLPIVRAFVLKLIESWPDELRAEIIKKYEEKRDRINKKSLLPRKRMPSELHLPESLQDFVSEKRSRERQRYIVIVMRRIENRKGDLMSPEDLQEQIGLMQNLVEGTMILNEKEKVLETPPVPNRKKTLKDFSTWDKELCVFGTERCIVYFRPKTVMENDGLVANYEDYWRCIVRGIEHTVSVRTVLHSLQTDTEQAMEMIPELVLEFEKLSSKDKEQREQVKQKLEDLASRTADMFALVPTIREITVTPSAFRSSHAVQKFEYLSNDCFGFPKILAHIQQNLNELTQMMLFLRQQEIVAETENESRRERRYDIFLSTLGVLFSIGAAIFVAPSFAEDLRSFCRVELPACSGSGCAESALFGRDRLESIACSADGSVLYTVVLLSLVLIAILAWFWCSVTGVLQTD